MPAMTGLGIRLKTARRAAGLTQVELAEAAGITQQTISGIERGDIVKTAELANLALALRVRWQWLASGELPMADPAAYIASPEEIRRAFAALPRNDQVELLAEMARAVAVNFSSNT